MPESPFLIDVFLLPFLSIQSRALSWVSCPYEAKPTRKAKVEAKRNQEMNQRQKENKAPSSRKEKRYLRKDQTADREREKDWPVAGD